MDGLWTGGSCRNSMGGGVQKMVGAEIEGDDAGFSKKVDSTVDGFRELQK